MSNPVAVYTACVGGIDVLAAHPEIAGVDWIAFTDDGWEAPGWQVRPVEHRGPPRLVAKWYKLRPDRCLPGYEAWVWVDASHLILSDSFVADSLACVNETGTAFYAHPQRDDIYQELAASLPIPKYAGQPLVEQVDHYRRAGHPPHWGLWATGTIARRNIPEAAEIGVLWWREIERWSVQDQLSLPVVFRQFGGRPGVFPLSQYERLEPGVFVGNAWHQIRDHQHAR